MVEADSPGKRDSMDAAAELPSKLSATHLEPLTRKNLGLTDLPASVRNKIYAHVLDTELVNVGKPNVSYTHTIKDSVLRFKASRPPFPVQTSLFYVNKQISQETRHFFYSKNLFVKFEVYSKDARHAKTMLEDSGMLFSVAEVEAVEACKAHAMKLTVVEKNSAEKRASVIFPAQYLPRLIHFMEQASRASGRWAQGHSLFLAVVNTYGLETARVQGDLLELFRLLTNIGTVTVEKGNLIPGYAEGLQSTMMAVSFEADAWLSTVSDMTDRAVEAREKKEYDSAAQHAQAAIISLTYGYLTRAETLHSQPESFTRSIQHLRWRTEITLATTLHSKHAALISTPNWLTSASMLSETRKQAANDLLAAETAASHAVSLATESPSPTSNPWFRSLPAELIPPNRAEWFTDKERGRSWYVLGLAHLTLGENLFAAGDLERASGMCSEIAEEVGEAFKRAREGIDWRARPGSGLSRAAKVAIGRIGISP